MPSTEELVKGTRAGDVAAFAELVRRYERAAIVTAYAVLGDFHLSQDAAQEAFIVAYGRLQHLRNIASFGPWLLRITRRRALRIARHRNDEPVGTQNVDRVAQEGGEWIEPFRGVVQQIARLPEQERVVMVMRYLQSRPVKEIADCTGRSVGTVTKQLSRAIARLRVWSVEVKS
jgi:RNA polymerase sigma-70 factor, ECF subfamily